MFCRDVNLKTISLLLMNFSHGIVQRIIQSDHSLSDSNRVQIHLTEFARFKPLPALSPATESKNKVEFDSDIRVTLKKALVTYFRRQSNLITK